MIHCPKNKQIVNTYIKQNKIRLLGDQFKWLHKLLTLHNFCILSHDNIFI